MWIKFLNHTDIFKFSNIGPEIPAAYSANLEQLYFW